MISLVQRIVYSSRIRRTMDGRRWTMSRRLSSIVYRHRPERFYDSLHLAHRLRWHRRADRLNLALIEQSARTFQLAAGIDHAQGGAVGELDAEAIVELKDVVKRQ